MTALPDRVGCYRHPDHLTETHCARCGRPVCAECIAGAECPSCLAERGAPPPVRPPSLMAELLSVTPVVAVLIAATAFVFVLVRLHPAWQLDGAQLPDAVAHDQVYRLVTAMFVHIDGTHLLFNMAALYVIGPPVERSVGSTRFLVLYLVAGVGGFVVSFLFGPEAVASVGASGAIFGVFGAWFFIARARGRDTAAIGLLITLLLTFSFYQAAIDWRAHVGGLATGAVLGVAFARAGTGRRTRWGLAEVVVACSVLAFLALAVVIRSDQLRS